MMNRVLFRQIWNERRSNAFLWMELLLVFGVLWYIVDTVYVTTRVYFSPMGFEWVDTYRVQVNSLTDEGMAPDGKTQDDFASLFELVDRLKHHPDIEAVSLSQNTMPFNDGANGYAMKFDTIEVHSLQRIVTPDYFRVFRYQNIDGSGWESLVSALEPNTLVVSVNVADTYPGVPHGKELLGKEPNVQRRESSLRIAALTEPVRYDHFTPAGSWYGRYTATYFHEGQMRWYENVGVLELCIRVREGCQPDFSERLMAEADRLYQVGDVYIQQVYPIDDLRVIYETDSVNQLATQLSIMFFLMLNIFLGVIGTFWFRTQQRRSEMGLRMALGAPKRNISRSMMAEGILLLTLAALPALVICLNLGIAEIVEIDRMPFTTGRFLAGIGITYLLIACMIVAGVWYPARQAMKVQPAEALHDE